MRKTETAEYKKKNPPLSPYTFDEGKHIHLLNGEPLYGTTTVIKEVMPPFLAKWGAQCAVDFLKAKYKEGDTILDEWEKNTDEAVNAWTKVRGDAAQKGTDMHAALENYVKLCLTNDGKPMVGDSNQPTEVNKFAEWSLTHVKRFIASEVHSYHKELWVGGIIDCIAEMLDGSIAIIDFKSSPQAYFNQFVQVSGYAKQVMTSGYGSADGSVWFPPLKITKLIIVPFRSRVLKPDSAENVEGLMQVFEKVVDVYEFLIAFKKR